MGLPTGIDLIGSNAALQEHWIKRFIAIVIDAIILAVVTIILNVLFLGALFGLGLWWSFITGLVWVLYSTILEASSMRATIGKKVMNLQVVAVGGVMNVEKALIRNLSKIHPLFVLVDWVIGIATQGDPRQRTRTRTSRSSSVRCSTFRPTRPRRPRGHGGSRHPRSLSRRPRRR